MQKNKPENSVQDQRFCDGLGGPVNQKQRPDRWLPCPVVNRLLKNYCGGRLRRCAVLTPSPNSVLCLGRCAPCALYPAFLMTFFKGLLNCKKGQESSIHRVKIVYFLLITSATPLSVSIIWCASQLVKKCSILSTISLSPAAKARRYSITWLASS